MGMSSSSMSGDPVLSTSAPPAVMPKPKRAAKKSPAKGTKKATGKVIKTKGKTKSAAKPIKKTGKKLSAARGAKPRTAKK